MVNFQKSKKKFLVFFLSFKIIQGAYFDQKINVLDLIPKESFFQDKLGSQEINKEEEYLSFTKVANDIIHTSNELIYFITNYINSIQDQPSLWNQIQNPLNVLQDDTFKSFEEICVEYGYIAEKHYVRTEDGYINLMHRVYKNSPFLSKKKYRISKDVYKPAVIMLHGLIDSSDSYILNGPGRAPGFIAADEDYDVWVPNTRGNRYSVMHETLDPYSDEQYWDHSFSDFAKKDLPAFINYIKNHTKINSKQRKISIIGHSQGSAVVLFGLGTLSEFYQENINLFVGLGAVSRVTRVTPLGEILLHSVKYGEPYLKQLKLFQIGNFQTAHYFLTIFCNFNLQFCNAVEHFLETTDTSPIDQIKFRQYFGHYPAGSSIKCFNHFYQIFLQRKFQDYDYGEQENLKIYGTPYPTQVSFKKIKQTNVPIALYVAKADTIVFAEDSKWIKEQLGEDHIVDYREIEGGHLAYFLGYDADYFKENIMDQLRIYNPIRKDI